MVQRSQRHSPSQPDPHAGCTEVYSRRPISPESEFTSTPALVMRLKERATPPAPPCIPRWAWPRRGVGETALLHQPSPLIASAVWLSALEFHLAWTALGIATHFFWSLLLPPPPHLTFPSVFFIIIKNRLSGSTKIHMEVFQWYFYTDSGQRFISPDFY